MSSVYAEALFLTVTLTGKAQVSLSCPKIFFTCSLVEPGVDPATFPLLSDLL